MLIKYCQSFGLNRGFEVLKNRTFRVSPDSLLNKIQINAGDELSDIAQLYGVNKAKIPEIIGDFLSSNVVRGRITGEKLSDLRNTISRSAYSLSQQGGESAVRGFAMRKVLGEIENSIESQLTPQNLAKFKADKTAYKTFLTLNDSIFAASKKIGQKGSFSPQDWMNALSSSARKDFGKGIGVFQKEADNFAQLRSRVDEDLQKAKDLTKNFINLNIEAKKAGLTQQEKRIALQEAQQARVPIERETQSLNELKANLAEKQKQLESIQRTLPNDDRISMGVGAAFAASLVNGFADLGTLAALGTLAGTQGFQRD
jgi:hypothetical protein